ncbi:DUF6970 domain-containing protein [Roseateles sp. BYS78W]|uniref:DUF6970 domain-containing protein n=1 Tax=Pelomonas candidula TaxID=3299025 RepID=A0ABW7H590_9BURK
MRLGLISSSARGIASLAIALLAAACSSAGSSDAPARAPEPEFVVRDGLHAAGAVSRQALAGMTPYKGPDGRLVYLSISPCCDMFNKLYDADGRFICAPSGGFTGQGDGRCPHWVSRLLWPQPADPAASNPSHVAETHSGENPSP